MHQLSIILQICRFSLAGMWVYQGLVPKILRPHADELMIMQHLPTLFLSTEQLVFWAGVMEVVFGLVLFISYRKKWVYKLSIVAMVVLLGIVTWLTPQLLIASFNAISLNMLCIALAWVALICLRGSEFEWTFKD